MRCRSAISRSSLHVGPDVTSGLKCQYNCEWISRLYLANDLRTTPPPPESRSLRASATLNFPASTSAFTLAFKRLLFSTSDDIHLLKEDI